MSSSEGHAIIQVKGIGVWSKFKHESGKHNIQRVPPTETKGRSQTSTLSVAVLPLPPEKALRPLPKGEVETKTQRGHGKGGQHQNVTDSAVRMVHRPTGISVFINGRKQLANKRDALRILTARVNAHFQGKEQSHYDANRKSQLGDSGRAGKIRTYNFIKNRIVDHRLGKRTNKIKQVMRGRLDLLLD